MRKIYLESCLLLRNINVILIKNICFPLGKWMSTSKRRDGAYLIPWEEKKDIWFLTSLLYWASSKQLYHPKGANVILACEQALLFGPSLSRSREAHFACPNRRACSQAIMIWRNLAADRRVTRLLGPPIQGEPFLPGEPFTWNKARLFKSDPFNHFSPLLASPVCLRSGFTNVETN